VCERAGVRGTASGQEEPVTRTELRVLRALRSSPLYRPALELVVGYGVALELQRLKNLGLVERAGELGPHTWRITDAGLEELERHASDAGP
jgi:chromosome segregation and condensation protein ScpB